MLNLKITAVILFHDEKLEDLLKTINSAKDEVDDIYIITTTDSIKKLKEENIVIIKDNLIENDFSSIRNKNKIFLPDNLLLHLNVGEVLTTKCIKDFLENKNYKVSIVYDSTIVKESRISNKNKFIFSNKIFESIEDQSFELNKNIFINASACKRKNFSKILNEWQKEEPLNNQINYYKAINFLINQEYDNFLCEAEKFLFNKNIKEENEILIRYYICLILLFKNTNKNKIIQNITTCLAKMPHMAEFWCFCGDYWYENKNFYYAKTFYEYAIISGKQRNFNDDWFLIPEKYKKYPTKMIESCKKILDNQTNFTSENNI